MVSSPIRLTREDSEKTDAGASLAVSRCEGQRSGWCHRANSGWILRRDVALTRSSSFAEAFWLRRALGLRVFAIAPPLFRLVHGHDDEEQFSDAAIME